MIDAGLSRIRIGSVDPAGASVAVAVASRSSSMP